MDHKRIHEFANKWLSKYLSPKTLEREVNDSIFAQECFALDLKMDCGESFMAAFPEVEGAFYHSDKFKECIENVDDVQLLGSAIFTKYRWITHWTQSDLLKADNREWFVLALERLRMLTINF